MLWFSGRLFFTQQAQEFADFETLLLSILTATAWWSLCQHLPCSRWSKMGLVIVRRGMRAAGSSFRLKASFTNDSSGWCRAQCAIIFHSCKHTSRYKSCMQLLASYEPVQQNADAVCQATSSVCTTFPTQVLKKGFNFHHNRT